MNLALIVLGLLALPAAALAQQRPLVTEDPETIGANRTPCARSTAWRASSSRARR